MPKGSDSEFFQHLASTVTARVMTISRKTRIRLVICPRGVKKTPFYGLGRRVGSTQIRAPIIDEGQSLKKGRLRASIIESRNRIPILAAPLTGPVSFIIVHPNIASRPRQSLQEVSVNPELLGVRCPRLQPFHSFSPIIVNAITDSLRRPIWNNGGGTTSTWPHCRLPLTHLCHADTLSFANMHDQDAILLTSSEWRNIRTLHTARTLHIFTF